MIWISVIPIIYSGTGKRKSRIQFYPFPKNLFSNASIRLDISIECCHQVPYLSILPDNIRRKEPNLEYTSSSCAIRAGLLQLNIWKFAELRVYIKCKQINRMKVKRYHVRKKREYYVCIRNPLEPLPLAIVNSHAQFLLKNPIDIFDVLNDLNDTRLHEKWCKNEKTECTEPTILIVCVNQLANHVFRTLAHIVPGRPHMEHTIGTHLAQRNRGAKRGWS